MTAPAHPLTAGLQRREAFRVRVPAANGPYLCLRQSDASTEPLRLQLLDLSLTGCAAHRPTQYAARLALAPWCAATLELELDLHLPLRLLAHEVTPQAGPTTPWRCSWVLVRPQDEPVLQRWLTHAQQQQRQLERFSVPGPEKTATLPSAQAPMAGAAAATPKPVR